MVKDNYGSLKEFYDIKKDLLIKEQNFSNLAKTCGKDNNMKTHPGEKGNANEEIIRKEIKRVLPSRMSVTTGFIEAIEIKEKINVERSNQLDIIIYDNLNNSPLYSCESWSVIPIEAVYGVVEVKSILTSQNLEDSINLCKRLRELSTYIKYIKFKHNKPLVDPEIIENEYIEKVNGFERWKFPAPRFFLFAYNSDIEDLVKTLEIKDTTDSHFHGICILENNQFIIQKPFVNDHPYFQLKDDKYNCLQLFLEGLYFLCDSFEELGKAYRDPYFRLDKNKLLY